MSSPTMMICLRKARIGEGVSGRIVLGFYLVFFLFLFLVGKGGGEREDRPHLLHVPGLHILAS